MYRYVTCDSTMYMQIYLNILDNNSCFLYIFYQITAFHIFFYTNRIKSLYFNVNMYLKSWRTSTKTKPQLARLKNPRFCVKLLSCMCWLVYCEVSKMQDDDTFYLWFTLLWTTKLNIRMIIRVFIGNLYHDETLFQHSIQYNEN